MLEADLVDNDVVFKICCFGLESEFKQLFDERVVPCRLALATFVLPKKIARSSRVRDKAAAQDALATFLAWAVGLEPTEDEVSLAAEIEEIAQQRNVDFDSGESLLLAVLLHRASPRLLTGDKRAIVGVGTICTRLDRAGEIAGRIVCFEQVLSELLERLGARHLVDRICREPDVDLTASICCGCASGGSDGTAVAEGLQSYIRHLRENCGNALAP